MRQTRIITLLASLLLGLLLAGCANTTDPGSSTQVRVRGQWEGSVSTEHSK